MTNSKYKSGSKVMTPQQYEDMMREWAFGTYKVIHKKHGGPAFPISYTAPVCNGPEGQISEITDSLVTCYGMSLRDYFAAKAMQAQQAALWSMESAHGWSVQEIANESYAMADAMLKAREQ
jgi:hypothetical protein